MALSTVKVADPWFRRSLLDVRVKRGADAGSDRHLVTARIQLKLKRTKPREGRVQFNVQQFQDIRHIRTLPSDITQPVPSTTKPIKENPPPKSLEDTWKGLKTTRKDTCEEVVGRRTANNKTWLSTETHKKVSERRGKKEALNRSKTRVTRGWGGVKRTEGL